MAVAEVEAGFRVVASILRPLGCGVEPQPQPVDVDWIEPARDPSRDAPSSTSQISQRELASDRSDYPGCLGHSAQRLSISVGHQTD